MLRFRRMQPLQKFASFHASLFNHLNQERSLSFKTLELHPLGQRTVDDEVCTGGEA
jgi:hypothetical protein